MPARRRSITLPRMKRLTLLVAVATLTLSGWAGADREPLPTPAEPVDLDQYAGEWYVHGAIPLKIPFFSDAEARNYLEYYERTGPETIRMTSSFDAPNDKRRSFSFKASVIDDLYNATWSIGLVWPLKAKYSIMYLDEGYQTTVVASPKRNNAWIMSREPYMSDERYAEMLGVMADAGFDPTAFRKVPHDVATPGAQVAQLTTAQ